MSDPSIDLTSTRASAPPPPAGISSEGLLPQLVQHLRQNRTVLREEWARRINEAELLTAMSPEELFGEATAVYDNYVEVLETGSVEALQAYARDLSERIIPRGVETDEVLGIVLLLRDVLARSLFEKYQSDFTLLNRVLDAYEPAANRIANTVGVSFVQERERIIRQQQEAIRELSTPVLQVREQLLILPIIGVLDSQRARQLTEQLLRAIRANRAKVVVIDITGVPTIDSTVANHLVQTVDASGSDGRERHHHRPVVGHRADARHDRAGPVEDERGRRPAGWHRRGGTPAGLRSDPHRRAEPGEQVARTPAMPVPILKQGTILIATVQAALSDSDTERLQHDLMEQVSRFRAHGIIVDVTAIDVMDSFAARSLRTIAHMTRLRGADTVIVGLQPEVAFAMVQLGLAFDDMHTALDLEEGLALLNRALGSRKPTIGRDGAD